MTKPVGDSPAPEPGPSSPKPKGGFADLLPRALSGIVLVVVALTTAIFGGWSFDALWWAASIAILWEWQRLVSAHDSTRPFAIGAVAITLAAPLRDVQGGLISLVLVLLGTVAVFATTTAATRILAACGVLYASALVLSVTVLRASFPFGLEAILWLFAVVWGTDIMAYFGGRLIGGPKLSKTFSPSKTWSGFLVGITAGSFAGLMVAPAEGPHGIYLAFGLIAGAVAQAGDILESALKRKVGVKDSSHLIPGHGGVMDRLDGFLAAALFAVLLGLVRFGIAAPAAGLFKW